MSPFVDKRFSDPHPPLLSTFSLLSSSCSSDFFLRRSPGSFCEGMRKLEKDPPEDRFSTLKQLKGVKGSLLIVKSA